MSQIIELTAEQEALLPKYREHWIKIGLATSTESMEIRDIRQMVDKVYEAGNLEAPKHIIFLSSPLAGYIGAVMINQVQVWDQVGAQINNQVRDQVRDQVWDQVWDQVRDQVWDQVWNQVREQGSSLESSQGFDLQRVRKSRCELVVIL